MVTEDICHVCDEDGCPGCEGTVLEVSSPEMPEMLFARVPGGPWVAGTWQGAVTKAAVLAARAGLGHQVSDGRRMDLLLEGDDHFLAEELAPVLADLLYNVPPP